MGKKKITKILSTMDSPNEHDDDMNSVEENVVELQWKIILSGETTMTDHV